MEYYKCHCIPTVTEETIEELESELEELVEDKDRYKELIEAKRNEIEEMQNELEDLVDVAKWKDDLIEEKRQEIEDLLTGNYDVDDYTYY